jgi:hypothetical protein
MKWSCSSYCASLFLGVLLTVELIPETSHAEVIRRQQFFGRSPSFINTGFGRNVNVGNNRFFTGGFNRFAFGNNRAVFNPNGQFEEVAGFSNLLKVGNALIERNKFGQIRRLSIDGNGVLRGASEADTVRQLREFYLNNFNKFRGANLNTVQRFLARNGGLSDGRFVIDLTHLSVPPDVLEGQKCEYALKTLNFLLNSLQFRTTLAIPTEKACPRGIVELDLGRFFNQKTLALFKQADTTSACTGRTRLDRLVAFMMEPNNYYNAINAPETRGELSQILGVQEDKTQSVGNKVIIENHESGVASGFQRILEVQPTRNIGTSCYRSLDNIDFNAPGATSASRSVELKGINFTHDAEEWLCLGANGFMQGYLFNGKGDLLRRAPAEIASNQKELKRFGPSIAAVASCLDCHATGFIGGTTQKLRGKGFKYTDTFSKFSNSEVGNSPTVFRNNFGQTLRQKDFFVDGATYQRRAEFDSNSFLQAQQRANAQFFKKDGTIYPLIPNMIGEFNQAVTPKRAADSLGISEQQAAALFGAEKSMDRTVFEEKYCNLLQGRNSVLSEGQNRTLLGQETADGINALRSGAGLGIGSGRGFGGGFGSGINHR